MAGYAKVFDSLLTSSLWVKDHYVLRIWIAMLARCDAKGIVEGSVPGFASLCRVTEVEMVEALEILTGPDPYSRTPDFEGRRLEVIPGGWRILNYKAYRAKGQEKEGSKAPFMRNLRVRRKGEAAFGEGGNALPEEVTGDPTATAVKEVPPTVVSGAPSKPDLEPLRQEVLAHWRVVAVAAGLPDVLKLSDKLRRAMDARLKDTAWLPLFREAVTFAARHPSAGWMRGQGDRHWKATLDWFLKPDNSEKTAARGRASPGRSGGISADASTAAQVQQRPSRTLLPAGAP